MKPVRSSLVKVSSKVPTGINGSGKIIPALQFLIHGARDYREPGILVAALNTAQAIANLGAPRRAHLPDRHEIEIVGVFKESKRALIDGIFMTPALVKLAPSPVQMIVGTFSNTQTVLQVLGLDAVVP